MPNFSSRLGRALQHGGLWSLPLIPLMVLPHRPGHFDLAGLAVAVLVPVIVALVRRPTQPPTVGQVCLLAVAGALAAVCLGWFYSDDRPSGLAVVLLGLFGAWRARDPKAVAGTLLAMLVAAVAMQIRLPVVDPGMRWMWFGVIFSLLVGLCYPPAAARQVG